MAASLGSAWGYTGGRKAAEELCSGKPGKKIQKDTAQEGRPVTLHKQTWLKAPRPQ